MLCEKSEKLKNNVLLYLCVSNISVFGATTGAPYLEEEEDHQRSLGGGEGSIFAFVAVTSWKH